MVLLLAPLAQAGTVGVADLTASSLQANGVSEAMGNARAFVYRSYHNQDQAQFTLSLTARHVHIEADHAQSLIQAGGADVDGTLWSTTADHDGATATLQAVHPHFKVEIFALDGHPLTAELDSSCLWLTLPAGTVEASKFAQSPRPIPSVSTQGTLQFTPCVGSTSLRGSFLLVLWEASLHVETPQGNATYHSGQQTASARSPDGTTAPIPTQQYDQLYVTVEDAQLSLDRLPGSDGEMMAFLGNPTARVQGSLEAFQAHGQLVAGGNQDLPLHVQLDGDLRVKAAAVAQGIQAHVDGASNTVQFNGQSLLLSTTAQPVVPGAVVWVGLAGVAAVAGTAVLVWRRRGREPWQFLLAGVLLEAGSPRLALLAASLKLGARGDRHAIRARIYLDKGDYQRAMASATRADLKLIDPFQSGANRIVASLAAARLMAPGDAGRWYAKAVQANPRLAWYLRNDGALHRISRDPEFRDQRTGAKPVKAR